MVKYKITQVVHAETSFCPILVSFENGILQEIHQEPLLYEICSDEQTNNVVIGASENLIYKGVIKRSDFYNNFLVTVDKDTNEATLIAVEESTMSSVASNEETVDSKTNSIEDFNVSMVQLHKQFGSKKAKRQVEQKERLTMNIDNIQEYLEQTAAEITVHDEDIIVPAVGEVEHAYKPPINRDASNIDKIYILSSMIPDSVLNTIDAHGVLQDNLSELGLNSYCEKELSKLQEYSSLSSDYETPCKILIYLDCLVKFLSCAAKNVSQKKYYSSKYSQSISQHIFNNFTVISKNGRLRPLSMRDKTICYALVLAVLANNYKVNLNDISKGLNVGIKKLQEMAKILALSPAGPKDKTIYCLKLPLPVAVSAAAPKRMKR